MIRVWVILVGLILVGAGCSLEGSAEDQARLDLLAGDEVWQFDPPVGELLRESKAEALSQQSNTFMQRTYDVAVAGRREFGRAMLESAASAGWTLTDVRCATGLMAFGGVKDFGPWSAGLSFTAALDTPATVTVLRMDVPNAYREPGEAAVEDFPPQDADLTNPCFDEPAVAR